MINNMQQMVMDFHKAFNLPIGKKAKILTKDRMNLRTTLHEEEVIEFKNSYSLENAAKELADILYVVYGTAIEMGIDIDIIFKEVHKSNMNKLNFDGKPILRKDGKIQKPKGWKCPNIKPLIDKML